MLYMFDHRSLCFRVRMLAALKRHALPERVVLDDDSATMISLVSRRVMPILVKDDGLPMLESMDMVAHIESLSVPVLTGQQRPEVAEWAARFVEKTPPLTMPRYPLLGLREFATPAALVHYTQLKYETYGDFAALRARTAELIDALMPDLDTLNRLIEGPQAVNGTLSLDDIHILPLLRSAAVVKDLNFPGRVRDYFETMMDRIGFQPLPAV